ncbi:hypothetical protein GDO86_003530 [Hymenochirus boettgeri]|uniref:Uncharacterized protein n=1 Tax=Hymenochirus boettgeri TaxID=247094 RepID=A0A8T2K1E7_9PIPI|nr:hypothetical protein GDO86_003530 [Hymenochirus boettgeri]
MPFNKIEDVYEEASILRYIIKLFFHLEVYVDEDEFVIVESNAEKNMYMFTGSLVIKDSCMLEPWKVNRTAFQHRIEKAYSQSPALQSYFVSAKVNNVFNGENTTAFVTLNFSLPTSKKDETKYKMSKEFVGGVLRQDIYDEEKSICQNSTVLLDPFHVILAY